MASIEGYNMDAEIGEWTFVTSHEADGYEDSVVSCPSTNSSSSSSACPSNAGTLTPDATHTPNSPPGPQTPQNLYPVGIAPIMDWLTLLEHTTNPSAYPATHGAIRDPTPQNAHPWGMTGTWGMADGVNQLLLQSHGGFPIASEPPHQAREVTDPPAPWSWPQRSASPTPQVRPIETYSPDEWYEAVRTWKGGVLLTLGLEDYLSEPETHRLHNPDSASNGSNDNDRGVPVAKSLSRPETLSGNDTQVLSHRSAQI
ncbi:hypothetical protein PspLS_04141 [Pyricularia sp. CBS 133598]|nr:hypothetical protein PspLS_04141 [Pyricularia sp. CBS 133598]